MVLHFQIEVLFPEYRYQFFQRTPCSCFIAIDEILLDLPFNARTKSDEPGVIGFQEIVVNAGTVIVVFPINKSFGNNFNQIMIAFIIFCQQDQMAKTFLSRMIHAAAPCHVDFTPQDGLDSLRLCLFIEVDDAVHIAMIGNRHCRHSQFFGPGYHFRNAAHPIKEAVLGMHMKMYKRFHSINAPFIRKTPGRAFYSLTNVFKIRGRYLPQSQISS